MKKLVLFFAMLWAGFANAQSITIIQPNGGEVLYACQAYTVKWSQTGSPSNYWNIDYSLDGGTIWTSVTSNYLSTNGQFVWTVPHVQSSTVLMRVKDALNSSTIDQSDAFFTINIPITLTSPNGGETWQGGTVHNITWNSVGTSNTFTLRYSTDNGSTWNTIVNNYSTASGTYAWTVPVIPPSTTCLVQVYDYLASCTADQSDAVFTYVPPTPLIQMPNGGETLYMNCSANIFWDPSTFFSNVDLYYSLNNGSTWTMIVSNTPNDGGQLWTVPITPSNTCLIKAANTASPSVYDVSDATFTIAPVHLVSPNGGQTLTGCNTYTYTWTKSPCIGGWNLYYSTDNGATWTQMLYNLTDNGQATQTVSVQMPANVSSTQGLFKISSYNYPAQADVSDATFTFTPSHDITLTYPTGGQTLAGGSTAVITWTTTGNTSGQYELVYNDGSTNTFIGPVTGTSYTWTVPNVNPTKTNCTFQIWDNVNSCKRDISTTFTVTYVPPTPILLTPNGGETLNMNCSANISWNTSTFFSNVDLYYSLNNGSTWTTIVTNTPNDGSQPWTVPISPSNTCLIKAANTASASVYDVSDATFTIAPVHLVSPNGGENLVGCTNYTITWTKSPCMGNWQLSFSTDNGATWNAYSTIPDNGLATQSYNYPVPSNVPSTQALFRVVSANYPAQNDVSDATFTITPSHDITLTYPTGGQNLMGGSTAVITWTTTGNTSGQYELVYNDGSTNTFIGPVTGTSYTWTVPNVNPTKTNCTFQIWDNVNSCKRDISTTFTVTYVPPTPILLTPNGGETLNMNCSANISWNTSTFFSNVDLYYSLNNGSTWTTIVTNTPNDGSQPWTVPISPSNTCLIKAANTASASVYDVSDATFTIAPVHLVSPNGGENLVGCTNYTITWTKSPCMGNWQLSFSTDNGATWNAYSTIPDNGLATQSYGYPVPSNVPSTQALFRVVSANYPAQNDVSDATFTITPSHDITLTYPTGGQTLAGGSTAVITWTTTGNTSGQYELAYNDGSTNTFIGPVTGTSYTWTVPNVNPTKTNCTFQIWDNVNSCKRDAGTTFTVTYVPPTPLIQMPNGGETLYMNCSANIFWDPSTFFSNVNLYYSLDNGSTWTTIVTNTPNDGGQLWTVPITPSNTCLIKAANTASPSVYDVSDATFTIAPVHLVSPNGGQTLTGCNTYTYTWTKSPCIGGWNLYYSTDNGATWTQMLYNLTDNGQATQTVSVQMPANVSSTQGLFKISSYNYPAQADVSDATFTFTPSHDITLTYPTGGQTLAGGSTAVITWTTTGNTSGQYYLFFYDGTSTTYTAPVTGNSYTWTVPNTNPTKPNCTMEVVDYQNSCKRDASTTFTVTYVPPTPILLTPNGGETLNMNCSANISWNTSTFFSNVDLYYSLNNGSTWTTIVTNTPNDGSQPWTVPISPSNTCLIKAANTASASVYDVSDATFTIAPVHLVSPNGGENLVGCTTYTITWTKSPCMGNWQLSFSTDNGATWNAYSTIPDNGLATQSYNYPVPSNVPSTQALFRVVSANYPAQNDVSDATFTITPSHDITLTYPTGGQNLMGGSTAVITWTTTGNTSGQYELVYNDGSTNTFIGPVTGTSYTWTVPNVNPTKTNCTFQIWDNVNSCKRDISTTFTVTYVPPVPMLLTPNGGESLYAGTSYNISWNTSSFYSTLNLYYSLDNGVTWTTIVTNTPNDGSQAWTVPTTASTLCLVKAANYADPTIYDVSDAVFTIKPPVTVLTPNGDNGVTVWGGCTVTSITFDHSPAWSNYKIEYSLNNGTTWNTIISSFAVSTNPATYNWTLPNYPTSQALVRVSPVSVAYSDQSDATFTITKPVTIIQPNFGGIMQAGTVYPIKWQSDGISNIYDIFYSTNGGATYTTIITGYNTSINTYSWTVPATVSNNCRIIVRDNINTCKTDTSDQAFIIQGTPPGITLLTPNGQDTLKGCSTYNITWNDAPAVGPYNIQYSINSGTSWTNIVTNYSTATHNYSWLVPNTINSQNVLVKVMSTATTTVFDESDALLRIVNGKLLATPHSTAICSGGSVQINSSGGTNYNWSPATALSAANIANPVASPTANITYTVQSNNSGCILQDTVHISVSPAGAVAGITITASPSNTVCPGTLVTFTGATANGGTTPGYQWTLNGSPVSTNATYTTNTINNNDVITCTMTSTLGCVVNPTVTSNAISMSVVSSVSPSVAITASPSNTICTGATVTFSAMPSFGGTTPAYQWKKNSTNVATTSTYTSNTLVNGDVITVVMTSNAACVSTTTATSNAITIATMSTPATPAAISGSTAVCANGGYTYSVAPVAGATAYNWTLPTGWTGTSSSNTIAVTSYTANGTMSVSASNACGTSATKTLAVTISTLAVSVSGPTVVCSGSPATLTASGASTYSWSTSQATSSITVNPLVPTTYTVTGTNAAGCSNTAVKTVSVNALPNVSASSATICAGNTASLSAAGASTYSWSTGATTASITVSPGSTAVYTVTGTSSVSCVNTATAMVTVNSLPTVAASSATICAGDAASLTASGASTYSWSTGANTASISVSPSSNASYTVTGIDGNGCSKTATAMVNVNAAPPVTASSFTICPSAVATLTASGASTYTWSTGQSGSTLTVSPGSTTAYTVTGSSAAGCTNTAVGTVSVASLPTVAASSATICAGNVASLTASGASTYTWSTGQSGGSISVSPASGTSYTVAGTSSAGCTNTAIAMVSVNSLPAVTASSATICAGNAASLTASGANTYTWSTGANTMSISVSPSNSTSYTVTGTDGNSCVNTMTTLVNVNAAPPVAASSATICAGSTATLTASGASTYTWSNTDVGNATIVSPAADAAYTVTGTDANGCMAMATGSVSIAPDPSLTVNSPTICAGSTATLTVSGANTYTWSTGTTGSTETVSPSANTDYTVTGTSMFGCSNTATTTVVVGSAPAITVNSATVCAGSQATLSASGVNSYSWSTGANTAVIQVSPSATAVYTVTGSLTGCSTQASNTATVTVNSLPTVSVSASASLVCAGQPVSLTASGTATSYSWSSGSVTNTESVSPSGTTTYTVTGTDGNSCSQDAAITITVTTCTGIEAALAATGQIIVYPNPASDYVTVESSESLQSVSLVDMLGKTVLKVTGINKQSISLDLQTYEPGVYFVEVRTGTSTRQVKIVKR